MGTCKFLYEAEIRGVYPCRTINVNAPKQSGFEIAFFHPRRQTLEDFISAMNSSHLAPASIVPEGPKGVEDVYLP
jgi:hypothetical protein